VRRDAFDADLRRRYAGSPPRRSPCLRDPKARDAALLELGKTLEALGDARPRFLSLADEPSETLGLNPRDACTCEACLFTPRRRSSVSALRYQTSPILRFGTEYPRQFNS
jgi:hypothetical protein